MSKTARNCPVCGGMGKLITFPMVVGAGIEVIDCAECDGGRATPASVDDEMAGVEGFVEYVEEEVKAARRNKTEKPKPYREEIA